MGKTPACYRTTTAMAIQQRYKADCIMGKMRQETTDDVLGMPGASFSAPASLSRSTALVRRMSAK